MQYASDHTTRVIRNLTGHIALCSCGWDSNTYTDTAVAEMAATLHRPTRDEVEPALF